MPAGVDCDPHVDVRQHARCRVVQRLCVVCLFMHMQATSRLPLQLAASLIHTARHWRQPRRRCRGHIPPIFWLGDVNGNIPPQYYYVLSDIADQYWLPSVRSASSRFHSAIRRHQFASVRQADSRFTRLVPPNLELASTPLRRPNDPTRKTVGGVNWTLVGDCNVVQKR